MSHVFISYSTRDSAYANRVADKLRSEGFNVWIDHTRLRSSEDWWRSIVYAIDSCAAFLVILTPESDQSKWVQREITLADQRDKPIFPLLLEGDIHTPNWALFVRTQYEDVRGGQLPGPDFYEKLAHHAPRQRGRGTNISNPRLRRPKIVDDPALRAAADNPPHETQRPPVRSGRRGRRLTTLVILCGVILAGWWLLVGGGLDTLSSLFPNGAQQAPSTAAAHYEQGMASLSRGENAQAIEHFSAAIAIDPDFGPAYLARGQIYAGEHDPDRANHDFQQALDRTSDPRERAIMLTAIGWVYFEVQNREQARTSFEMALGSNPIRETQASAHIGLGWLELGDNHPEGAIHHFQQAAEALPERADSFCGLGEAYDRAGDLPAALEALRACAERSGGQVEAGVLQRIRELEELVR